MRTMNSIYFLKRYPSNVVSFKRPVSDWKRFAVRLSVASLIVWMSISGRSIRAQDVDYRQAMARAVRAAAGRVLPSVVALEIIGTGGGAQGDVAQDAPTSGLLIDNDGYVLASSIVIEKPSASVLAVLPDGTRQAARVIARDHHRDLVLLKIDATKELKAISLPQQMDRRIGQTIIAVGRYGSDASPMVSRGVLSAEGRLDGIALQCDARVSPSLYGGPLIDLYGNVLGILIPAVAEGGAETSTSWYDSGIAFAIPSEVLVRKLEQLKSGEDVRKGLIGIVSKVSDPYQDGTEIAAVRSRSPAEAAGIEPGDVVLEVDGESVRRHQEIRQILGRFDAGETIDFKLERDGSELELRITLAESIPPLQPQRIGIITSDRTLQESEGESTELIVSQIVPGTPAVGKLQPNDVIVRVGDAPVADSQALRRRLTSAEPERSIPLTIRREGDEQAMEVSITPEDISGELLQDYPEAWNLDATKAWETKSLKLPEAGNVAAYVAPQADEGADRLGLLVLLLNPGQGAPEEVLKSWVDAATSLGVVVCAIAPEDARRWQPKELEVVGSFTAAVMKQAEIDPAAVAVAAPGSLTGSDAEAADAMAVAVAFSQSNTFFGVAVSAKTKPPALRLRENESSTSLQLLVPVGPNEELPPWSVMVQKAGYPVVRGGETSETIILRWVRLLQAI